MTRSKIHICTKTQRKVIDLAKTDMSVIAIAKHVKVRQSNVSEFLRLNGIDIAARAKRIRESKSNKVQRKISSIENVKKMASAKMARLIKEQRAESMAGELSLSWLRKPLVANPSKERYYHPTTHR